MIERLESTRLPTSYGNFVLHAYNSPDIEGTHLALVLGDIGSATDPLVRIHSECLTGDLLKSLRCDCGQQLEEAMRAIQRAGEGALLYLRQEGRGIGLVNKLRAYNLQDQGMDTVAANIHLGFDADLRDFGVAISILEDLDVSAIRLLTNNPEKVSAFDDSSIDVVERVPMQMEPGSENIAYLRTKRDQLGHMLDLADGPADGPTAGPTAGPDSRTTMHGMKGAASAGGPSRIDAAADPVDECWSTLLALTDAVKSYRKPVAYCSLQLGAADGVRINEVFESTAGQNGGPRRATVTLIVDPKSDCLPENVLSRGACFRLRDHTDMEVLATGGLSEAVRQMIVGYGPYCFASLKARRSGRAFAVSHFAQSLDSRIATTSGHSQGIGGTENLTHAHRMRALCDGILIGARTLQRDLPKLTVRHVSGRNPRRIVLASSLQYVEALFEASPDPVLVMSTEHLAASERVEVVTLPSADGQLCSASILEALYARGIQSVYIEGGSYTTSRFLNDGCLDVVQLHLSPMILGSGVPTFSLPEVERISESLRFDSHAFVPFREGTMFVGSLGRSSD